MKWNIFWTIFYILSPNLSRPSFHFLYVHFLENNVLEIDWSGICGNSSLILSRVQSVTAPLYPQSRPLCWCRQSEDDRVVTWRWWTCQRDVSPHSTAPMVKCWTWRWVWLTRRRNTTTSSAWFMVSFLHSDLHVERRVWKVWKPEIKLTVSPICCFNCFQVIPKAWVTVWLKQILTNQCNVSDITAGRL